LHVQDKLFTKIGFDKIQSWPKVKHKIQLNLSVDYQTTD